LQVAAQDYASLVHDLGVAAHEALAIVNSSLSRAASSRPDTPHTA